MISNGHCPIAHYLSESDTIPAMGMKMRLSDVETTLANMSVKRVKRVKIMNLKAINRFDSKEFSPKSLDPLPQPNPKQATHGPRQLLHQ